MLKSLALQGERFECWVETKKAVGQATTYWNTYRQPYVWKSEGGVNQNSRWVSLLCPLWQQLDMGLNLLCSTTKTPTCESFAQKLHKKA